MQDDEPTMTVDEAARLIKIGRTAAYAGTRTGEIPSIRIGGRVLVLRAPLKRILDGRPLHSDEVQDR